VRAELSPFQACRLLLAAGRTMIDLCGGAGGVGEGEVYSKLMSIWRANSLLQTDLRSFVPKSERQLVLFRS
jgi:hypothetical protein